ncbi:MAG: hypothetical protein MHPSP_003857, partial [Paramarteilia canceri]
FWFGYLMMVDGVGGDQKLTTEQQYFLRDLIGLGIMNTRQVKKSFNDAFGDSTVP